MGALEYLFSALSTSTSVALLRDRILSNETETG